MPNNEEVVAAILTAGMLPTLPAPRAVGRLTDSEQKRLTLNIGHAVSLYAAVLEGLLASASSRERLGTIALGLLSAPLF